MSQMGPDATFREGLERGEIRLQKCRSCGQSVFFPRVACPNCHGIDLDWQQVSGKGEVYTTTTVRRKPERGGDYNVCMVELAEGARMMSRVTGFAPDLVAIGMAVTLFVGDIDDTAAVLCKPAEV
ncbi:MAG: DNA-binding protein [Rhodobacteraceae bacterium]|nr:MAG: DNA-binding protein [Paracoccaceae bacterium]